MDFFLKFYQVCKQKKILMHMKRKKKWRNFGKIASLKRSGDMIVEMHYVGHFIV
jgi:hypothetical protein